MSWSGENRNQLLASLRRVVGLSLYDCQAIGDVANSPMSIYNNPTYNTARFTFQNGAKIGETKKVKKAGEYEVKKEKDKKEKWEKKEKREKKEKEKKPKRELTPEELQEKKEKKEARKKAREEKKVKKLEAKAEKRAIKQVPLLPLPSPLPPLPRHTTLGLSSLFFSSALPLFLSPSYHPFDLFSNRHKKNESNNNCKQGFSSESRRTTKRWEK